MLQSPKLVLGCMQAMLPDNVFHVLIQKCHTGLEQTTVLLLEFSIIRHILSASEGIGSISIRGGGNKRVRPCR